MPGEAPTPQPSRSAAPSGGAGGSGGGGAPGPVRAYAGTVLDQDDRPIAGATVLMGTGAAATTDEAGAFRIAGASGVGPCLVSADGYQTSLVAAGELPDTLHLQRQEAPVAPEDRIEVVIRGAVTWPTGTPMGGAVYYRDNHGSVAAPVVVDPAGLFALRIQTRDDARPRGAVLALAAGADGRPLIGVSTVFSLRDQGSAPVQIESHEATVTAPYETGPAPAVLPVLRSRLEICPPGLTPFVLESTPDTQGSFQVPEAGRLDAVLRIAVEAESDDHTQHSLVTFDPYAAPAAVPPDFLEPPIIEVLPESRTIRWSNTAWSRGVLLSVGPTADGAPPEWEGWFEGTTSHRFEPVHWPAGPTFARVIAVDGPEATARRVASASQLRLSPTDGFTGGFRRTEARVTFAP